MLIAYNQGNFPALFRYGIMNEQDTCYENRMDTLQTEIVERTQEVHSSSNAETFSASET